MRKYKESFEPFVKLSVIMLTSAAWKVLTPNARLLFPHWLAQWTKEHGHGRLIMPAHQTSWMMKPIHRAAADRDLVARGFLDVVDPGGILPPRPKVMKASERWKAISRDLVVDKQVGQVVNDAWEPLRRATNPTEGTLSQYSRKRNTQRMGKDTPPWKMYKVVRTHVHEKDDSTSPDARTHNDVSRVRTHVHEPSPDARTRETTAVQTGSASKRPGRPKVIKPAPAPQGLPGPSYAVIMAVQREIRAGKGEAELRELVKAQGFDPEKVEWKILQRGVS